MTSPYQRIAYPLFKLDAATKEPVRCTESGEWAAWFEKSRVTGEYVVATTDLGAMTVSTVFTGLDARYIGDGPPLIFETMLFSKGGNPTLYGRDSTWAEALARHEYAVIEHGRRS